jgi:excisionase family DNA binding protein
MNPNPDTISSAHFELAGKGYDPDQLLTVEDLARRLQISTGWVRDHATRKRPRLPVVRVGKLLRFRREEIEKWIEDQSQRSC